MSSDWKLRKAEEQVEPLLHRVASVDRGLLSKFPRPVEDLLCACAAFTVSVERVRRLTERAVQDVLRTQYGVSHEGRDDTPLAGYCWAQGRLAVIFANPDYGPESELFTLAHEAGHLVVEHLPTLAAPGQASLFGESAGPGFFATRDPPGHLFVGDSTPVGEGAGAASHAQLKKDRARWLREVVANGFAAELLAPHRELRRVVAHIEDAARRVELVRQTFGLSRTAAGIRLAELGYDKPSSGTLSFK